MTHRALVLLLLGAVAVGAFGQSEAPGPLGLDSAMAPVTEETGEPLLAGVSGQLLLAMSDPSYPVTPADIYRLVYIAGTTMTSVDIVVGADYQLNLGVFGTMSAEGKTFPQLKADVERRVRSAYPESSPALAIASLGRFQVTVVGEVVRTTRASAWGLSHLRDVVLSARTRYASLRAVKVTSARGETRTYDLFRAERFGDATQDPLLRPGDRIVLSVREREVSVSGQVLRSGSYQLLPGEGLDELLREYAGGFTARADTAHIEVTRWDVPKGTGNRLLYVDASAAKGMELHDLDSVVVPSRDLLLPLVTFEGAVGSIDKTTGLPSGSGGRMTFRVSEGELLSSLLQRTESILLPDADAANAYLERRGETAPVPVDLTALVSRAPAARDIELAAGDRIVVPARRLIVTVSGAVTNPGRYPYVPRRLCGYYINLAGGIDPSRQVGDLAVRITDAEGRQKQADEPIEPDDTIFARTNSFWFYAQQVVPLVTGTATIALSLVNLVWLLTSP